MPKGGQKLLHQALKHPNLNNVRGSARPCRGCVGLSVGEKEKWVTLQRQEVVVGIDGNVLTYPSFPEATNSCPSLALL